MPDPILAAGAALLGLVVGSFLNVVIYRLPLMLERQWRRECREVLEPGAAAVDEGPPFDLVRPRSTCPACKTQIRAIHNIPVVSFLLLGGRCAACRTPIPWRYPVIEIAAAVLAVVVVMRYGASAESAAGLLLCWALLALAVIDLDHQILPDVITLPLLWIGVVLALLGDQPHGAPRFTDLPGSVIGAMAGYLSLWLVYHAFRLATGKEGMGYGDFKLLAAIGAWLGWQSLPLVILLSAFVGAITGIGLILVRGRDRQLPLPFGPFLAAAGLIALLWGDALVGTYLRTSGL